MCVKNFTEGPFLERRFVQDCTAEPFYKMRRQKQTIQKTGMTAMDAQVIL